MNFLSFVGVFASLLTIVAYLPQVLKSWKTKDVGALSLKTFATFCIASAVWIGYGVMRKDFAVILTNAILLCFQLSIVYLQLKRKAFFS